MAHPTWPNGLPAYPRRGEWKMSPTLPPIATDMEGGNTRQRARPGDNVREITQTLRFSNADYATFEAFYLTNRNGRITMPVFIGGSGLTNKTVQIMSSLQDVSHDGLKYSVPMKLRVYSV